VISAGRAAGQITVIDIDQGQSGASAAGREGFQQLGAGIFACRPTAGEWLEKMISISSTPLLHKISMSGLHISRVGWAQAQAIPHHSVARCQGEAMAAGWITKINNSSDSDFFVAAAAEELAKVC
jgi:hypothetical protein